MPSRPVMPPWKSQSPQHGDYSGLVMEWAEMHQSELLENWTAISQTGKFEKVAPLI